MVATTHRRGGFKNIVPNGFGIGAERIINLKIK